MLHVRDAVPLGEAENVNDRVIVASGTDALPDCGTVEETLLESDNVTTIVRVEWSLSEREGWLLFVHEVTAETLLVGVPIGAVSVNSGVALLDARDEGEALVLREWARLEIVFAADEDVDPFCNEDDTGTEGVGTPVIETHWTDGTLRCVRLYHATSAPPETTARDEYVAFK
jgi:hypothetical protein